MKINSNGDKYKSIFALPNIIIGYNNIRKELDIIFIFACWSFTIEFIFK